MTDRRRLWATFTVFCCAGTPILVSAAEPVQSLDIVAASAFLEAYRTASEQQSGEFYELYSDRAVIRARIEGRVPGIAFQGRAFKAWGRQLLRDGRSGLDGSIFRNVTVEQRGGRLLIRAQRYSTTRCYWDVGYQVGIEREGTTYRIVDERLTTQPASNCILAKTFVATVQSTSPPAPNVGSLSSAAAARLVLPPADDASFPSSDEDSARQAMPRVRALSVARPDSSTPWERAAEIASIAHPDASLNAPASTASMRRVDATNDLRVTPAE